MYIYEHLIKPEIKTRRVWDSSDVRQVCIDHQFYTAGDNEDYCAMLRFVDEHEPTAESLYTVAVDILDHSHIDADGCGNGEIASIMFSLEREAVRVFYEIGEEA